MLSWFGQMDANRWSRFDLVLASFRVLSSVCINL